MGISSAYLCDLRGKIDFSTAEVAEVRGGGIVLIRGRTDSTPNKEILRRKQEVAGTLSSNLSVALKEWHTVCRALESGRQMLLLRKGGIYEAAGEFELEHRNFLLFPTYLHQNLAMLKPTEHAGFEPATAEPARITLSAAAMVTDIVPVTSRAAMDSLDAEHVWTKPLIDMRFNYKPQNPLYLLLVRAYRLTRPVTIDNTVAYSGCKSWVPLDAAVSTTEALAVIDEGGYQIRRQSILKQLKA